MRQVDQMAEAHYRGPNYGQTKKKLG